MVGKVDLEVCYIGVLQEEGQLDEAAESIVNYVRGGFAVLQYGSINYLPCYAAAGLLVKLGIFDSHGKVWSPYALFIFFVCLQ